MGEEGRRELVSVEYIAHSVTCYLVLQSAASVVASRIRVVAIQVQDVEARGVFMGAAGTAFLQSAVLMESHVRTEVNMTIIRTSYGASARDRLLTLKAASFQRVVEQTAALRLVSRIRAIALEVVDQHRNLRP